MAYIYAKGSCDLASLESARLCVRKDIHSFEVTVLTGQENRLYSIKSYAPVTEGDHMVFRDDEGPVLIVPASGVVGILRVDTSPHSCLNSQTK